MKPQPAPPVFTPELAAKAVMQAIRTSPRELMVGGSVLKLVFGDMVLPGYFDRRLAGTGTETQKSERPEPGGRPDNLLNPSITPSVRQVRLAARRVARG